MHLAALRELILGFSFEGGLLSSDVQSTPEAQYKKG